MTSCYLPQLGNELPAPYDTKYNELRNILQAIKNPVSDQIIEVPEDVRLRAKVSLDKMLEFT